MVSKVAPATSTRPAFRLAADRAAAAAAAAPPEPSLHRSPGDPDAIGLGGLGGERRLVDLLGLERRLGVQGAQHLGEPAHGALHLLMGRVAPKAGLALGAHEPLPDDR